MVFYEKENLKVRIVEEKDIPYILKYFEENNFNCDFETGSLKPSKEKFKSIIEDIISGKDKTETILVLEKDNIAIGYLSCFVEYDRMTLGHIAVKKEERNNGYGKLLTKIALKIAANENRDVVLKCYYKNNSYLKELGFKTTDNFFYIWNGKKEKNEYPIIFMTCEEYSKMKEEKMKEDLENWKKFLNSDIFNSFISDNKKL